MFEPFFQVMFAILWQAPKEPMSHADWQQLACNGNESCEEAKARAMNSLHVS